MRVLAIDQGTSATKAIVVDDGRVIATAESPCPPTSTTEGGVEVSPDRLWQSVLNAGREALSNAGGGPADAIGLANQGETIVAWQRHTGEALGNAIVWQDRRSADLCAELAEQGWDKRLAEITGLELDPYFVAPKIAWLRHRVGPDPVITTSDVWLLNKMCGSFVTDVATASRTLLLDLETTEWSVEACAAFDIDPASLPAIVANSGVIGETSDFGGRATPVTGICVDQQAALFGQSCVEAGDAKCTYGTGAFLLATTGQRPVWSSNGLVGCVAWRVGDETTWCLDGQVFTVGAAVTWLQQIGVIDGPADLDGFGATVADSGGVTFVPALAGLGAPFWAPNARGSLNGLSLGTTKAHLVRAVIEGIAAQVTLLARAASDDLGSSLQSLRVDGGLTRSDLLLQTQADLLQLPIEVFSSPNATVLGVANFAHQGASGPDEMNAWQRLAPLRVVEPEISADEADSRIERFLASAQAGLQLDA